MKVLLVDDEPSLLLFTATILRAMGHEVECSSQPDEAARMVEIGNFDIAFVDYRMPGHDGAWFMKNARIPRRTKVLLMTGNADRDVINQMFKAGVRGYLIKPFQADELKLQIAFHTGHALAS